MEFKVLLPKNVMDHGPIKRHSPRQLTPWLLPGQLARCRLWDGMMGLQLSGFEPWDSKPPIIQVGKWTFPVH